MRRTLLLALVSALSTGVVSIGSDTYSVAHEDNGPASSLAALKAQAYKDASSFCAGKNQEVEVVRSRDTPRSFGQFPSTEVVFRYVAKK